MDSNNHFDLLILGSGSTAFAGALRARELGKNSLMIEERILGGTCVNRGCLPSKNLIEAAKLMHDSKHPRYPGLKPTNISLDFATLIAQKDEVVHAYREKKYHSLLGSSIQVVQGHGQFLDPHTVAVNGTRYTGERILIATGSRPTLPPIQGLDEVPYLTSDLLTADEPIELTELPLSLLIVGGGYIAVELGQMFQRFGTQVTIVEMFPQLLPVGYEPEVGPALATILEAEGIQILVNTKVESVRKEGKEIVAKTMHKGQHHELRAESLLIATGRKPNTDAIAIEKAGVALDEQGAIQVDAYLQTNVAHIFAAGDVIGTEQASQMATPVGSQDGGKAAYNAFVEAKQRLPVNHRVIPRAVFTDPPVAVVGMTEAQVQKAGRRCWCTSIPMSLIPRAAAIRKHIGFLKMVADWDTNAVLGVTMIGPGAEEVIHEAAMALHFHAKLNDFIDLIHVYPTMAEGLKIAAISRFKDPTKLSCCAE